ncbi:MAG TPA: hypothetical protein VEO56_06105 [Bacteroidota bacterium]|nr:hypothetical protein [Bacteroidota bacterium]
MNATPLQEQIDCINNKLDRILEEIELQQRHRREIEDLKADLMRVGKDLYQSALVELEDVHDSLGTGDMLYLGKKVLRNVPTITAMVEQIESIRGFLQDAAPLARDSFIDFMNTLDELDRKGYFAFMRELGKVFDRVVTSFSVDDVRSLGDNVVTLLTTVKNLTQPEILHTINNAMTVYKNLDVDVQEEVSLIALLREFNSPEAKKGMAYALRVLKALAATSTAHTSTAVPHGDNHGYNDTGS